MSGQKIIAREYFDEECGSISPTEISDNPSFHFLINPNSLLRRFGIPHIQIVGNSKVSSSFIFFQKEALAILAKESVNGNIQPTTMIRMVKIIRETLPERQGVSSEYLEWINGVVYHWFLKPWGMT